MNQFNGCSLNDGEGCYNLANLYLKGLGVDLSLYFAKDNFRKSCNLKYGDACSMLGLFYSYDNNSNGKVKNYYQMACDLDSGVGCFHLGLLYKQGVYVIANEEKSNDLFEKSRNLLEKNCNFGKGENCYYLAKLNQNGYGEKSDPQNAISFYEKGCEFNEAESCASLGVMYIENLNDNSTFAVQKS